MSFSVERKNVIFDLMNYDDLLPFDLLTHYLKLLFPSRLHAYMKKHSLSFAERSLWMTSNDVSAACALTHPMFQCAITLISV